jgi:hypothetical protein
MSYNYTGLTAGDKVEISNFQGGVDSTQTLQLNPQGVPYASYYFGETGGTAQVIPGSSVRYRRNSGLLSNSSVSIPAHRLLGSELITGRLSDCTIQGTNLLETLSLQNFDYFDQDGNSIFSTFNRPPSTGIINLVSSRGTTGVLYTGPTGSSAGSGVPFTELGGYNISFADPVPVGQERNQKFDLSFYDMTDNGDPNHTRGSTATLYYDWPGMSVYPEQIIVNNLTTSNGETVSISFSSFDYLDNHGFSIFNQGHTGTIEVYGPPFVGASGVLVGSIPYGSGPYTIQTTGRLQYQIPTRFVIAFNDFVSGIRSAVKVFQITWEKETLQLVVYTLPSEVGVFNFEIGSLDYFSGDGTSLMYTPSGPTGYIQLMGPTGMLAQYPVSDIDTRYIFTY